MTLLYSHYMWCDQAKWVLCRDLSNFSFYSLFGKAIRELCFAENSIKIRLRVPKVIGNFFPGENNKIQKGIAYHNWMYLEIDVPDIWLIPLDHLTYTCFSNCFKLCNKNILLVSWLFPGGTYLRTIWRWHCYWHWRYWFRSYFQWHNCCKYWWQELQLGGVWCWVSHWEKVGVL